MGSVLVFGILIWLASILGLFWLWNDASEKRGSHIGCLWVLIVFALGPIGFIAYLIIRDSD